MARLLFPVLWNKTLATELTVFKILIELVITTSLRQLKWYGHIQQIIEERILFF